jgi:hypothetical protein
MSRVQCFTSFTFSYLPRALILVRTLRQAHPDWKFWALMVDACPPGCDLEAELAEFDHVVYAEELGFERYHAWMFKHDIVEASTAVKGQMLCHLLEQGAEKVVYLDPDIAVFHRLDGIIQALDTSSIILTPHQVSPNTTEGAVTDNEVTSLKYGTYNLGFVAVRNDAAGREFSAWWARQLYFACYDDVPNGIFTDQKWCDLVPALFDRVRIERDPGYNVASWNLSMRRITFTRKGDILVNGSPLKFYHFTKINSAGDLMTEKYAGNNVDAIEVWNWYKRVLAKTGALGIPAGYWHYGAFDNGVKIPKAIRELYRHRTDLYEYFENPFVTAGDSLYEWVNREMPNALLERQRSPAKV